MKPPQDFAETRNEMAGPNPDLRVGFSQKSDVALGLWPDVARLKRLQRHAARQHVMPQTS